MCFHTWLVLEQIQEQFCLGTCEHRPASYWNLDRFLCGVTTNQAQIWQDVISKSKLHRIHPSVDDVCRKWCYINWSVQAMDIFMQIWCACTVLSVLSLCPLNMCDGNPTVNKPQIAVCLTRLLIIHIVLGVQSNNSSNASHQSVNSESCPWLKQ